MDTKTDDKRERGLYGKFRVERTDGRDQPGEKHDGCRYFVLDVDHDPHARAALLGYAESCRADGYGPLADDLEALVVRAEHAYSYTESDSGIAVCQCGMEWDDEQGTCERQQDEAWTDAMWCPSCDAVWDEMYGDPCGCTRDAEPINREQHERAQEARTNAPEQPLSTPEEA